MDLLLHCEVSVNMKFWETVFRSRQCAFKDGAILVWLCPPASFWVRLSGTQVSSLGATFSAIWPQLLRLDFRQGYLCISGIWTMMVSTWEGPYDCIHCTAPGHIFLSHMSRGIILEDCNSQTLHAWYFSKQRRTISRSFSPGQPLLSGLNFVETDLTHMAGRVWPSHDETLFVRQ